MRNLSISLNNFIIADFQIEQIQVRKGRPRLRPKSLDDNQEPGFLFPAYDSLPDYPGPEPIPTTPKPTTTTSIPLEKLSRMVDKHKLLMTVQFRTFQMDAGSILFKVSYYSTFFLMDLTFFIM